MPKVELLEQAQCACGWNGKRWYLFTNAQAEMIEHVRKGHAIAIRVVRLKPGEKANV